MWWSTICTQSSIWRHCPLQGQFSYMISSHTKRLTFVDTSSTSWPWASLKGTQGQSCHSPLSSWASFQRKSSSFWAASLLCLEITPLLHTQWLEAQLPLEDPKLVCLKYQGIVLRKREEIQRRRLRDSPLHQRVLLSHHLKHQHEDLIDLIASLLE